MCDTMSGGNNPETDEYGIRKPIDKDYIDPPTNRAETKIEHSSSGDGEKIDQSEPPPSWRQRFDDVIAARNGSGRAKLVTTPKEARFRGYDWSHTYGRGPQWDVDFDATAPTDHDGRAETRTRFNSIEAPAEDRDKWDRLGKINDGMWAKERSSQNASAHKRRMIQTFAAQLACTDFQKERSLAVAKSINASHMAHYSMEAVVLAIISLVVNEDGRWIRDEQRFKQLVRDTETTVRGIRKCRILVKAKSGIV